MRIADDAGCAPLSSSSPLAPFQLPLHPSPSLPSTLDQLPPPPVPYANDDAGKTAYRLSMSAEPTSLGKPMASEPAGKNKPSHKAPSHPGIASEIEHQALGFLKGFFWDAPKEAVVDTGKLAVDVARFDPITAVPLAIIDPKGTARAAQELKATGMGLLKIGKLSVDASVPGAILFSGPSGVRDDVKTAKSLVQPEIDDWTHGDEGEASGRGLFDLASLFIPGGAGDAAKATEGAALVAKSDLAAAHAAEVGDLAAHATVDSAKAAAHAPRPFDLDSLARVEAGAEPGTVILRGKEGSALTVPAGDLGSYVTLPPGSHEIWAEISGPAERSDSVQLFQLSDPTVSDMDRIAELIGLGNIGANTDPMAGVPLEWTAARAKILREEVAPTWMPEKFLANQTNPDSSYWRKLSVPDQDGQWRTIGVVGGEVNADGEQWYTTLYIEEGIKASGLAQRLTDGFLKWADSTKPIHGVVAPHNKVALAYHLRSGFYVVPGSEHMALDVLPLVRILRDPVSSVARTGPLPFVPGISPGRFIPASESGLPIETWFAKKDMQRTPDGDAELWLNLEARDPHIHARIELKPAADGGSAADVTDLRAGELPPADMLSLMLKQDPRTAGITSIVFPGTKDADAWRVFSEGGRPETTRLAQLADSVAASLGRTPTGYEFQLHSAPSGTGGALDIIVRLGHAVRDGFGPQD